jgi:membrane-associated phospholipid phosphatase
MEIKDKDINIAQVKISKNKSIPIIIISICFYLVAVFLWQQEKIDIYIVLNQNYFFSHIFFIASAKLISRYGMGIISFLLAIQLIIFQAKDRNKADQSVFLYILISFATASIAGDLLKEVLNRARPVYELSNQIIQTETSSSPSFPSGHATKSMALALSFMLMMSNSNKTKVVFKILTLFMAILVCYSRIVLQKHYLSDILAGIGTALFFLVPSVFIVNFIFKYRNINENKLHALNNRIVIIFFGL